MLTIRLARGGAKKRPFYHIVVAEKTSPRDGRFIERLGFSNPLAAGQAEPLRLNLARYEHWREVGAEPSATVMRLVRTAKRKQEAAAQKAVADAAVQKAAEQEAAADAAAQKAAKQEAMAEAAAEAAAEQDAMATAAAQTAAEQEAIAEAAAEAAAEQDAMATAAAEAAAEQENAAHRD